MANLLGRRWLGGSSIHHEQQIVKPHIDQCCQNVFFTLEVVVKQSLGNLRLFSDIFNRGGVIAFREEQIHRCFQDLLPRCLTDALIFCWGTRHGFYSLRNWTIERETSSAWVSVGI